MKEEPGSRSWQVDQDPAPGGAQAPEKDFASSTCTSETELENAEEAEEAVLRSERSDPALDASPLLATLHPLVTGVTHVPPLNPPEVL